MRTALMPPFCLADAGEAALPGGKSRLANRDQSEKEQGKKQTRSSAEKKGKKEKEMRTKETKKRKRKRFPGVTNQDAKFKVQIQPD